MWEHECAAYLTSAVTGGQWTETRKAKLPDFTGPALCQLCLDATGTPAHRHVCSRTTPATGWTPPDEATRAFIDGLDEGRRNTLRDRAVLTVAIPIATPQTESKGWQWITQPPDSNADGLRWFVDGSRRYAAEWTLATTGCGVAVLDSNDLLVAYAWATPPAWATTANMAEAWAVLLTIRTAPNTPHIVTDCMAVLNAAQAGAHAAVQGKRIDARIWKEVVELTGGELKTLRSRLTWMPAHTAAEGVENKRKSDGKPVSVSEWRANQLADQLAKRGAEQSDLRIAADKIIRTASDALCHSAAQLGIVTRAANRFKVETVDSEGKVLVSYLRDSTSITASARKKKLDKASLKAKPAVLPLDEPELVLRTMPCAPPRTLANDKAARLRCESAKRKTATVDATARLVAEAASSATPTAVSATTRMQALRQRLSYKWSSAAGDAPASPNGVSCSLASCSAQVTSDDTIATPSNYEAPV